MGLLSVSALARGLPIESLLLAPAVIVLVFDGHHADVRGNVQKQSQLRLICPFKVHRAFKCCGNFFANSRMASAGAMSSYSAGSISRLSISCVN